MSSLKTRKKRPARPCVQRVYRLEKYTLHLEHPGEGSLPGRWKVSGHSSSGSYRRIRFDAFGLAEAQRRAETILFGAPSEVPRFTVAEAFARVIATRPVKAETLRHYRQFAGYFCDWVEENRSITLWSQLRFEHLHDYMNSLIKRGLSGKTIGHYLEPIRFTALWTSQNWPEYYTDFCRGARVPRDIGRSCLYEDQLPPGYLSIAEVCDFLAWVKSNHPAASVICPGVALQGLCGLQLQEALRLRRSHVDPQRNTITVEGEVKNRWRIRRLPLPGLVSEILRESVDFAPQGDERIVRYSGRHWKAYSSLVEGALDRWAGGRRPIAPKDLRNTLPTEATNRGWAGYFVNRYLGHAPQSMAERHYHGELSRSGEDLTELLREKVVRPVDLLVTYCTKLHDPARVIPFAPAL